MLAAASNTTTMTISMIVKPLFDVLIRFIIANLLPSAYNMYISKRGYLYGKEV